jgi:hypothetical protein
MTGEPYMVICNGVKTFTSDWLNAKLIEFRAVRSPFQEK